MVMRLTKYLLTMISPSESASLVKGYNRCSLSSRCALKIYLQKELIIAVLKAMDFPTSFIQWIKVFLTTPRYSISINGGMNSFSKGKRGIGQGDFSSPYIGTLESVVGIWSVLSPFYLISGLLLNSAKSEIFAFGIATSIMDEIISVTGFKESKLPGHCLGLPLVTRNVAVNRISNWSVGFHSYARRMQIIQYVIFNIQKFWSNHFILPKSDLRKINQLGMNSLGMIDLESWNKACRLKLIRQVLTGEGSI
ncbi:reverse transcriptase [Gossypium australe]|uniref:Reverse transcriptase n=1 Tax=Gossypium australe TaxID=47621 RepID=A0A5B6UQ44_9ROSI|nr:reverse transcriptase [Gossypium australe]